MSYNGNNGKNGKAKKRQEVGLTLLGLGTAYGAWSASNSSIFSIKNFVNDKQSMDNARYAMNVGLGLIGVTAGGIYLTYGKKGIKPAIVTAAAGLAFYAWYESTLRQIAKEKGIQ